MTQFAVQPHQNEGAAAALSGMSVVPAAVPRSPQLSDQEVLDLTMTDFMSYLLDDKSAPPAHSPEQSDGNVPDPSQHQWQQLLYDLVPLAMSPPSHPAPNTSAAGTVAALESEEDEEEATMLDVAGSSRSRARRNSNGSNSSGASRSGRTRGGEPNRNARMAKENRERKKAYVNDLEQQLADMQQQRDAAIAAKRDVEADLAAARQEVAALRASLRGAPAIAEVLRALGSSSNYLSFDGSATQPPAKIAGRKRLPSEDEQDLPLGRGKRRAAATARMTNKSEAGASTIIPLQLNIHVHGV